LGDSNCPAEAGEEGIKILERDTRRPDVPGGRSAFEAQDKIPSKPVVIIVDCSSGCGADVWGRVYYCI
jgi:hypothetical protein